MDILTLDNLGRVLIPRKVREQLGLTHETQLNLQIQDGRLILEPLTQTLSGVFRKLVLIKLKPLIFRSHNRDLHKNLITLSDTTYDHFQRNESISFSKNLAPGATL
jgi:AbrB family looped-hinge helix DNA binding protein